jgi:predicted O-linked N-acetylglucosamine transferase (SPINDLY family)
MLENLDVSEIDSISEKAYQYLVKNDYDQAIDLYGKLINVLPDDKLYYWYLGLAFLLKGEELDAQTTWLTAIADSPEIEIDLLTNQLVEILEKEAERIKWSETDDALLAWVIRQHIREIQPNNINNILHLLGIATLSNTYRPKLLEEFQVLELLKSPDDITPIDEELLLQVLNNILKEAKLFKSSYDLVEVSVPYVKNIQYFIDFLIINIYDIVYSGKNYDLGILYTKLGLQLQPDQIELLYCLSSFYQDIHEYEKGIEEAKLCYESTKTLIDKINANNLLMRAFMSAGGYWDDFCLTLKRHQSMLAELLKESPTNLNVGTNIRLFSLTFFLPYFQDYPRENYQLRHELAKLAQLNVQNHGQEILEKCRSITRKSDPHKKQRLKIGYISHCFTIHSVGWLARWLFEYHDREKFEIILYMIGAELSTNYLQDWYISKVDKAHKLSIEGLQNVETIFRDELDILVDLDSITLTNTCQILACKPAPIQVTWLGWDASGIPAIDYYIADPYVLPADAQEYYSEKIWRLPHTYLAVSGFELGVSKLRRDELNIPTDAIIYFTAQRAHKYHPDMAKVQMQILKSVPNSYFLIKGLADAEAIQKFFLEIAEAEGISPERIKFLPMSLTEAIHRADMSIADIVLDTYPYNGATTTMETLWLGIPMVTKVGQQFSARNSYTMMVNAGITEGIAWTNEEYLEWGIRLGKDENLRREISWKLKKGRQTAPLWNAKQFTREMENAYQQMWSNYIENNN